MAQVIEIQPDGGVVTYAGPARYSDAGAQSLVPPTAQLADVRTPPAEVAAAILASSQRHGVSADLIQAVAWQESRYRQTAVSPKGARGVMQLMPDTASDLGVEAHDLTANIDGGAAYLARMIRQFGDLPRALAAYNAGPAAVTRFGGVPPYAETRAYVAAILGGLNNKGSILK
jgi:soluble lytic murein transglycosylase-like protein